MARFWRPEPTRSGAAPTRHPCDELATTLQAVLLQLFVQGRNGDSEGVRGVHLISLRSRHGLLDGDAFDALERLSTEGQPINSGWLFPIGRQKSKVIRVESAGSIGEGRSTGQGVLQLAHV